MALAQRYSSAVVVQLSGFIVGVSVSKILGPELLGVWGVFHIIVGYFSYSNLGATNGLTRNLGIAIGQKNEEANAKIIGAANTIQFTLPLLAAITLIVLGLLYDYPYNIILITSGIVGFIKLYEENFIRILNAFEKHKVLANISFIRAVFNLIIVIPLVYFLELNGRFLAIILITASLFIITWRKLPIGISFSFDKKAIKDLIKIGFPLGMVGFLAANFFLVDRVIITQLLTLEELGFYVFGFYLVTVIKSIKQIIVGILYQRQNIIFGEDGVHRKRRLLLVSKVTAYFATDITGILSGFVLILFTLFVITFMPEYETSIHLTYIIVFSQVFGQINVMNTVGKHYSYLKIISISLVINILLSILLAYYFGLYGIAYATLISFVIYNLIINFVNLGYFNLSMKKKTLINFRILFIPAYCFIISKGLEYIVFKNISEDILSNIILLTILLLSYVILILPLFKLLKSDLKILNKIKLHGS